MVPGSDERITPGELNRLVERVERGMLEFRAENKSELRRMSTDLQQALRELTALGIRATTIELDLNEMRADHLRTKDSVQALDTKVSETTKNAAYVSGGIGALAWLWQYLPWGHK